MPPPLISAKKGFTLVELSIVLVIIGLLIDGILVAQSLIESTKLQSFVRQIQQYDAAVAQFKSRFNQIPGDSEYFDAAGDNNGKIDQNHSALRQFRSEVATFIKLLNYIA